MMKNVKEKTKQISFIKDGTILYELIGDENLQQFLKYDHISGTFDLMEEFTLGDNLYVPPQNELVNGGTILLANYPQEYGGVKALFQAVKRFVYNYRGIEPEYYKLRIEFKKQEVGKVDIIRILEEILVTLKKQ